MEKFKWSFAMHSPLSHHLCLLLQDISQSSSFEMYSTAPSSKHAVADCSVLERRHSSRFVVLFRNPLASVNQICHGDGSFKEKLVLVNAS